MTISLKTEKGIISGSYQKSGLREQQLMSCVKNNVFTNEYYYKDTYKWRLDDHILKWYVDTLSPDDVTNDVFSSVWFSVFISFQWLEQFLSNANYNNKDL